MDCQRCKRIFKQLDQLGVYRLNEKGICSVCNHFQKVQLAVKNGANDDEFSALDFVDPIEMDDREYSQQSIWVSWREYDRIS